jgi:pSer/pThr/pTyr-binding forkhead associated (FHA) protein
VPKNIEPWSKTASLSNTGDRAEIAPSPKRHDSVPSPRTVLLGDVPFAESDTPAFDDLLVVRAKAPSVVGSYIPLRKSEMVLGRRSDADVPLVFDDAVSGTHARIVCKDGDWFCQDEGSRNGTFVNGKRISQPVKLVNGVQLQVGTTVFSFLAANSAQEGDLPFPIAVSRILVEHQAGALARVKALLDALETTLRFIVATELAVARESAAERAAKELASLGTLRPLSTLSMGRWVEIAIRLASIAAEGRDPHVAEVAAALLDRSDSVPLADRLRQAVTFRNKQIGHGRILNEEAYRADEEPLSETFSKLLQAVRPLARHTLVSVAEMEFRGGKIAYTFYVHGGPLEFFTTIKRDLSAMLEKPWCYLLRDTLPPLSLAPLVFCESSPVSRKLEVFLADGIVLGPQGAKVTSRGITSNVPLSVEVQWNEQVASMFESAARPK